MSFWKHSNREGDAIMKAPGHIRAGMSLKRIQCDQNYFVRMIGVSENCFSIFLRLLTVAISVEHSLEVLIETYCLVKCSC